MINVLVFTLLVTIIGLVASLSSLFGARKEMVAVRRGGFLTSDVLEVRRHLLQQTFRATKLVLLGAVITMAILEVPPNPGIRYFVTRGALIIVILMISGSAIQERYANRRIIEEIDRERQEGPASNLYRALVESDPWGVLALDKNFNICYMNSSLERLSGWALKDLRGLHLNVLIPAEDREAHAEHEREYLANPRTRHGDPLCPRLLCRDGTTIGVEISLAPIDASAGLHFYASVRDRGTLSPSTDRCGSD